MNNPTHALILVSRKLARIPLRADLSLLASRAGWSAYEGSWDSDNGSPVVAALEAGVVGVVIAGEVPAIDGVGLDELLSRQGFHVVVAPAASEPNGAAEPAFWISQSTTFATGKLPRPIECVARLDSFEPVKILQALPPVS